MEILTSTEDRLDIALPDEELDKKAGISKPTHLGNRLTPRVLIQLADQQKAKKK